MTKVTAQMSVSLDGCYAGPRDPREPKDMAGWMDGPEAPGFFRVTRWLFDPSLGLGPDEGIELTPTRVIETPEVIHIRYAVDGRARLHLDDRGAGDA